MRMQQIENFSTNSQCVHGQLNQSALLLTHINWQLLPERPPSPLDLCSAALCCSGWLQQQLELHANAILFNLCQIRRHKSKIYRIATPHFGRRYIWLSEINCSPQCIQHFDRLHGRWSGHNAASKKDKPRNNWIIYMQINKSISTIHSAWKSMQHKNAPSRSPVCCI